MSFLFGFFIILRPPTQTPFFVDNTEGKDVKGQMRGSFAGIRVAVWVRVSVTAFGFPFGLV